jgi:hypothetical protein
MRRTFVFLCLFAIALSASARDSTDHWFEVRTPHFVVLTDTNEKQARRVADQFERMRAVFHLLMPAAADDAGSPIIVLALKDKKAFQALEPEVYLAKGQIDLAGLFMRAPDKNYILLRLDAQGAHPFATVYHEYTHYMMRSASEWLPLWLNEGLAEFYQNTDIQDKEVLLGQASENDILYLRQNRLLPITTLLKVDQTSPYYHEEQKGSVFYAESWALTHFIEITDAQKGTSRLQNYANLLAKKEDPIVAAQQAFGDLTQLQKSLNSYISQGQFMMFKMNRVVAVDESAFQFRAIPATDADAIRADVWSTMSGPGTRKRSSTPSCAMIQKMLLPTKPWAISSFAKAISRPRENGTAKQSNWTHRATWQTTIMQPCPSAQQVKRKIPTLNPACAPASS